MKQRKFFIATQFGRVQQSGFSPSPESFFAIHHDPEGPKRAPYWTVTFIPTGTRVDALFPDDMRRQSTSLTLWVAIETIEREAAIALMALSALPFGVADIGETFPDFLPFIDEVKAVLKS